MSIFLLHDLLICWQTVCHMYVSPMYTLQPTFYTVILCNIIIYPRDYFRVHHKILLDSYLRIYHLYYDLKRFNVLCQARSSNATLCTTLVSNRLSRVYIYMVYFIQPLRERISVLDMMNLLACQSLLTRSRCILDSINHLQSRVPTNIMYVVVIRNFTFARLSTNIIWTHVAERVLFSHIW